MNLHRQALHLGARGLCVRKLNWDLWRLGLEIPKNKYTFCPETENVVKTLQEIHDFYPSGKVDKHTSNLIKENVARIKRLKRIEFIIPKVDPNTGKVKAFLNKLIGLIIPNFGNNNKEILIAFQQTNNLDPKGILNRPTAKLIDDYLEQIENLKKLGFTPMHSFQEIEDEIRAFQNEHDLKSKGVLDDTTIESIEVEVQRHNRSYRSSRLPIFKQVPLEHTASHDKTLIELYGEICNSWRMLTDVRFKLLGFVPTVSIVLLINLLDNSEPKSLSFISRAAICLIGLLVTIGLYIYDYRNTELYDDLVSRSRRIETELGMETGQFLGRKKPKKFLILTLQHDTAINIIYISAIIAWLFALASTIFNWI
jgi:hypothetical protein